MCWTSVVNYGEFRVGPGIGGPVAIVWELDFDNKGRD